VLPEEFNDPGLKDAVKRVWGGQTAPAQLREAISDALARPAPSLSIRRISPGWLAMAAAVLMVVGVAAFVYQRATAMAAFPLAIAEPMTLTHDRCCKKNDHHFVPKQFAGEMALTGQWLSGRARVPVLAVDLGDGWNYCGAGPCSVGGKSSGHLLFKRGSQELSIFSMPASDFQLGGDDQRFAGDLNGHMMAGFTRGGGLYCVIGRDPEGKLSDNDVRALCRSLMDRFPTDVYSATLNSLFKPPPALAMLLDDGE
jgi:hypothetical protein